MNIEDKVINHEERIIKLEEDRKEMDKRFLVIEKELAQTKNTILETSRRTEDNLNSWGKEIIKNSNEIVNKLLDSQFKTSKVKIDTYKQITLKILAIVAPVVTAAVAYFFGQNK